MKSSIRVIPCIVVVCGLLVAADSVTAVEKGESTIYTSRIVPVLGSGPRHFLSAERPFMSSQPTAVERTPPGEGLGTWQELASVAGVVTDVSFPSATIGFASAELGVVWKTTDGGESWVQVMSLGFPYYWYGVHAFNENDVIVTGFSNTDTTGVARWSHDGGETWSEDIILVEGAWSFRVRFADASTGLVLDSRRSVPEEGTYAHFTTSGGETEADWDSAVAEPEGGWFGLQFSLLSNHKARAAGVKYCDSLDAGATWSCGPSIDSVFDGPVFFLEDDMHGWVGGGSIAPQVAGWVHRTTDGGATWTEERDLEAAWPIRGLHFITPEVGWAVGGNGFSDVGGIYGTTDGGETWTLDLDSGYETTACSEAGSRLICSGFKQVDGQWQTVFFALDVGGEGVLEFTPSSLDFGEVEVGTTSETQTAELRNVGGAAVTGMVFNPPTAEYLVDTSGCGAELGPDASCSVSVTFMPVEPGAVEAALGVTTDQDVSAELALSGDGVSGDDSFTPIVLTVDPAGLDPDGNGVFEPGESVAVAPAWRNDGGSAGSLTGTASSFTGPGGAIYSIELDAADYGLIEPGVTASCLDLEASCYRLGLDDPAARPAAHWDATVDETLDDADGTTKTWTLHVGASFADVPPANPFYSAIEALLHSGITSGCTPSAADAAGTQRSEAASVPADRTGGRDGARPLQVGGVAYCPGGGNSRAQMPVFVLRALEGADYVPLACAESDDGFDDVPAASPFCPWIRELASRGIVSGCGDGNYCPGNAVTRAQMSIFLLKTLEGDDYTPPECTGTFTDVPCTSLFARWIEELADRDVTGGCTATEYCPGDPVSRAQMAVFVTRTFGLALYGRATTNAKEGGM